MSQEHFEEEIEISNILHSKLGTVLKWKQYDEKKEIKTNLIQYYL